MEEMISRWIRETLTEYAKAKTNRNLYQMKEMDRLEKALRKMRETLEISKCQPIKEANAFIR